MCCCFGSPFVSAFIAIISLALALYLIMTSEPIFKQMYQAHQDPIYRFATGLIDKVDSFLSFLGAGKIDAGKPVRLLLWASGITLGMGAMQVVSSLSLLIGAARQYRGPVLAFSFISSFGCMLCLCCCYATQDYFPMLQDNWSRNTPEAIRSWQLATLADGAFLFFATCHTLCFVRSERRVPVVIRGADGMTYMAARTV